MRETARQIGFVGWLFVGVLFAILCYQLLVPPIVGYRDNGDFWRMTKSFGLRLAPGEKSDLLTMARYYEWDGRLLRVKMYPTTQLIPVGMALLLSRVVSKSGLFDIAHLGLVHTILYCLGFAVVAFATSSWPVPHRCVLYGGLLVIFSDVGLVAHFNSFLQDSTTLITLVFALALALRAAWSDPAEPHYTRTVLFFFLASTAFSLAKVQNVPVGIVLALVGAHLWRRAPSAKVRPRAARLGLWLAAGLMALSVGYWFLFKYVPGGIRSSQVYNMVFNEITRHSDNPARDLAELGLDRSYLKYVGTVAYDPQVSPTVWQEVLDNVGDRGVIAFYVRHPGRFVELAVRGAKSVFITRCPFLANFQSRVVKDPPPDMSRVEFDIRQNANLGSAHPYKLPRGYMSRAFSVWSDLKEFYAPKSLGALLLLLTANLAAIAVKWRRFDRGPQDKSVTAIHAAVLLSAALQFVLVLVGEGERDIVRHLFLFNVLSDICFVFMAGYIYYMVSSLVGRPVRLNGGQ